jgi:hypothetical protein
MTTVRVVTEGGTFEAPTAQGVVRQMRDTQWNAPERKREWMDEVTMRLHQSHGVMIPIGATAEEFLEALERVGVATVTITP